MKNLLVLAFGLISWQLLAMDAVVQSQLDPVEDITYVSTEEAVKLYNLAIKLYAKKGFVSSQITQEKTLNIELLFIKSEKQTLQPRVFVIYNNKPIYEVEGKALYFAHEIFPRKEDNDRSLSSDNLLVAKILLGAKKNSTSENDFLNEKEKNTYLKLLHAFVKSYNQYIIYKYIHGDSLSSVLSNQHLSMRQKNAIATTVIRALFEFHSKGLLHGDIKPANIIIEGDGRATPYKAHLIDFEFTTWVTTPSLELGGTTGFQDPKRVVQDRPPYSVQTEYFSLGIVLFMIFTKNDYPKFINEQEDGGNEKSLNYSQIKKAFADVFYEHKHPGNDCTRVNLISWAMQFADKDPNKRPAPDQIIKWLKIPSCDIPNPFVELMGLREEVESMKNKRPTLDLKSILTPSRSPAPSLSSSLSSSSRGTSPEHSPKHSPKRKSTHITYSSSDDNLTIRKSSSAKKTLSPSPRPVGATATTTNINYK